MKYRFVLVTDEVQHELLVRPVEQSTVPPQPPDGVRTIQVVEDWLPRDVFYDRLQASLPSGDVTRDDSSLCIKWNESGCPLHQIIVRLNDLAAPSKYGRVAENYVDTIGATPLVRIGRLSEGCAADVLVKLESMEPGSVKDRAVASMVSEAIRRGDITSDSEVVEASSGNLAFALSAILGVLTGLKPTIFMSKMHGAPKRRAVRISGSRIVLTNAHEGTLSAKRGAVKHASRRHNAYAINQHGNPDNPRAHRLTTGPEIYHQACVLAGQPPDEIVCSLGSGGTAVGLSMFRDDIGADFRIIGVEPEGASLLTGGDFKAHHFSGMAPGWVTDILREHGKKLDEVVTVGEAEAFDACRGMLVKEGFLVGPSSGAAIAVALKRAELPENEGKVIVAFAHDRGDRYLDVPDLFMPPAYATETELDDVS